MRPRNLILPVLTIFVALFFLQGCEMAKWRWGWPRNVPKTEDLRGPYKWIRQLDEWVQKKTW